MGFTAQALGRAWLFGGGAARKEEFGDAAPSLDRHLDRPFADKSADLPKVMGYIA